MKLLTDEEVEDLPVGKPLVCISYKGLDAAYIIASEKSVDDKRESFLLTDPRDIDILEFLNRCPRKQDVVVHNLSDQITSHILYLAFVTFVPKQQRKNLQAHFVRDGGTQGHGFIRFPHRRSAELAVMCMHEFEVCGSRMQIEWRDDCEECSGRTDENNKLTDHQDVNKNELRNGDITITSGKAKTSLSASTAPAEESTNEHSCGSSSLTYPVSGPAGISRSGPKTVQPARRNSTITVSSDKMTPNLPSSSECDTCTPANRSASSNTPASTIPSLLSICVPIMQAKSRLTSSNPLLRQCTFPMSLLPMSTPFLPTVSSIISSNPFLKTYNSAVVRPPHPLGLVSLGTPAVITSLPVYSSPVVLRHIYQNSTNSYHGPRPTAVPHTPTPSSVLPHLMTVYSPVVVAPSLVQKCPSVVYQTAFQIHRQQLQLPASTWAVHAPDVNQIERDQGVVKVGRTISDTVFPETSRSETSSEQTPKKRKSDSRWDQKIPWKKLKAVIRESKVGNCSENEEAPTEKDAELETCTNDGSHCCNQDEDENSPSVQGSHECTGSEEELDQRSGCESCGSLSCDGTRCGMDYDWRDGNGSCESCGSLSCEGFHGVDQYRDTGNTICVKCGSCKQAEWQENATDACEFCGYTFSAKSTEDFGLKQSQEGEEQTYSLDEDGSIHSHRKLRAPYWLTLEQKVHLLKSVCVRLRDAGVSGHLGVAEVYTETEA